MTHETALSHWARERPEAPCVFYRGHRGHFEWIDFSGTRDVVEKKLGEGWRLPGDIAEYLQAIQSVTAAGDAALDALLGETEPGKRDIWISWRSPQVGAEAVLAAWATRTGAAVLVERAERLPLETFIWARPTIVSGTYEELQTLFDAVECRAPRWSRRRWARQRCERLRAVLVEGRPPAGFELELAGRVLRFHSADRLRVVPFPRENTPLASALV